MSALLSLRGLCKAYGGIAVSRGVSLDLFAGERVALIGPNGAGKTSIVDLVTGMATPDAGRILLEGEDIGALDVAGRARRGLLRTFQISRLFREMTVEENLLVALLQRHGRTGRMIADAHAMPGLREEAAAILAELGLEQVRSRVAGRIAYGEQRLVEIAVALALRPRVLLLDEPAAGVPPAQSPRLLAALERLPPAIAVLMIEHDMDLVFRFASRIVVLAAGEIIFDGAPQEAGADPRVRAAYLGTREG